MTIGREDAFAEEARAKQAGWLARKTRRRHAAARGGLNGAARRSSDVEPELRFSGLRSRGPERKRLLYHPSMSSPPLVGVCFGDLELAELGHHILRRRV